MNFLLTDELNEKFKEVSPEYKEWFDNTLERDGFIYETEARRKVLELVYGFKPEPDFFEGMDYICIGERKYKLINFENYLTQR